jgi:hypothetical protein
MLHSPSPSRSLALSAASAFANRLRRSRVRPSNWIPTLKATRILWREYAHAKTVATQRAVDAAGNPLPWYTYPAIEFLSQLDFSDKRLFEYGAGMSTLFWAARTREVVSVEDDDAWHREMLANVPPNVKMKHEPDLAQFASAITAEGDFDVIVIDGPARGRTRLKCCRAAVQRLRAGGVIILDNSDWLPESSRLLRDSGLLEVDFTGFAPICGHVQTTSLYFDRAFNVPPLTSRQPRAGLGSRPSIWEPPPAPAASGLVEFAGEPFHGVIHDITFEKTAAGRRRKFRAVSYVGGDDRRSIAIFDLDRDRVALTRHRPRGRGDDSQIAAELERIVAMSWDAFALFITTHECRWFVMDA